MKRNDFPKTKKIKIIRDNRGWFAEVLRKKELHINQSFGQISITTVFPKQDKGGHYHKIREEIFLVISGKIRMTLRNMHTGKMKTVTLSDKSLRSIHVKPFWNHSIKNPGKTDAIVLLYSTIEYDPKNTDVYTK